MTMGEKRLTVPAGVFKARCLALIDRVAETGETVVISKRGKPVARLVPLEENEPPSLLGSVVGEGDFVSPIEADWDADR